MTLSLSTMRELALRRDAVADLCVKRLLESTEAEDEGLRSAAIREADPRI